MEEAKEILEELTLNRQPSAELETKCFKIIETELNSEEEYDIKEKAILSLVENYSKNQNLDKLTNLIHKIQPIVLNIQKSKTARLLRSILDSMASVPNTLELQSSLCEFLVEWCKKENRNFLRHKIQIRQANVLYERHKYKEAIEILSGLLSEARKIDDKHLLVEVQLLESKVYFSIKNYAKAKASLTACRAASNSIFCNPDLQSRIDSQAGIVNAHDKEFKNAYSYFFEAFESSHTNGRPERAAQNFQYMILCKIMMNSGDEVRNILSGKYGMQYTNENTELMRKMAKAHRDKSLREFQVILEENKALIEKDPVVFSHVQDLYENLLQQNLMKIVEPYSRVEIDYIAELVNLEPNHVQSKLSEMILDKKFEGTLDQGNGCLIVFEEQKKDQLYTTALDTLGNMDNVVDKLFKKAEKLKKSSIVDN